jgi:hypothetical protein
MKLLKNSFLGTVFLFALGTASIAGTSNAIDEVDNALMFSCSQTHATCNRLYPPGDFGGFDRCMVRGGCAGEQPIQSL